MLPGHHPGQRFFQREVGAQRENIGARHHQLANGRIVQFQGIVDHFFLEFRNLAKTAAGGHDQLELVRRVHHAPPAAAELAGPEHFQRKAARFAHDKKERTSDFQKDVHGRGYCQGDTLGSLQGQGLGYQLAQDDVQVRNQEEGDDDGDGVGIHRDVGDPAQEFFEQPSQRRLADPAQAEAGDGDAQLDSIDDLVQVLVQPLDNAGADAAGFDQLLDSGVADADQGKLGGREKGVGRNQEQDEKHPQQRKSYHGSLILTFQRLCSRVPSHPSGRFAGDSPDGADGAN